MRSAPSRFNKPAEAEQERPAPTVCIAHGCYLPPVDGFGFDRTAMFCMFHSEHQSGEKKNLVTQRMELHRLQVLHYWEKLRHRGPVDLEFDDAASKYPGMVGGGHLEHWNKCDDENWQQYKNRFYQQLSRAIGGVYPRQQEQDAGDPEPVGPRALGDVIEEGGF